MDTIIPMSYLILEPREHGPQKDGIPLSLHGHQSKIRIVPGIISPPPSPTNSTAGISEIICLGCGNSLNNDKEFCVTCDLIDNPPFYCFYSDKCRYCKAIKCPDEVISCRCVCHCDCV